MTFWARSSIEELICLIRNSATASIPSTPRTKKGNMDPRHPGIECLRETFNVQYSIILSQILPTMSPMHWIRVSTADKISRFTPISVSGIFVKQPLLVHEQSACHCFIVYFKTFFQLKLIYNETTKGEQ